MKSRDKKTAIYARVSTRRQARDETIDLQLYELREYVYRNKLEIFKEYIDAGFSGASNDRPQLNQLMNDAEIGSFGSVVVWKFDRFGRNVIHLLSSLEKFKELGINFISLRENIDTSTPIGKVFFSIIAAMAEWEREAIRERIISGMRKRKLDGKIFGKKPKLLDPSIIYNSKKSGMSLREISAITGLSRARISQILKEKDIVFSMQKSGKTSFEISVELGIRPDRAKLIVDYLTVNIPRQVNTTKFKYLHN
ncbi:MAG: recombinase family protein [Planctomycetes bacterium]|nr:recombinase family protein [Planctomycetota bacterium]